MRLSRTHCINFPRSGHHLLVDLLAGYFGSELRYCEPYDHPELKSDPEINLLKDHDFGLDSKVSSEEKVIVQIRDPLEAIASWGELIKKESDPDYDDWFRSKLKFYDGFVNKWIISPQPNRLILHYRELLGQPLNSLARVIAHISPDRLDCERIIQILSTVQIVNPTGIRSCHYFGHARPDLKGPTILNPAIAKGLM